MPNTAGYTCAAFGIVSCFIIFFTIIVISFFFFFVIIFYILIWACSRFGDLSSSTAAVSRLDNNFLGRPRARARNGIIKAEQSRALCYSICNMYTRRHSIKYTHHCHFRHHLNRIMLLYVCHIIIYESRFSGHVVQNALCPCSRVFVYNNRTTATRPTPTSFSLSLFYFLFFSPILII